MTERRRYTKKQKLAAVMAAEMSGVTQAERETGIPKETIHYWLNRPEFAQFRTKAREEMAEEIKVVAHLAWMRTAEALYANTLEPRDVLFAAEKASSLVQLLAGQPTSRTETRTWTDDLNDDEKQRLRDWIDSLDDPATADGQGAATGAAQETGPEVR
jgi:transposase-like protein